MSVPAAGKHVRSIQYLVTAVLALVGGSAAGEPTIAYVPGSTVKLEQLIGDFDKETQQKTANQTNSRYSIEGTDLCYSFEHQGKLYFLFGDTIGHTILIERERIKRQTMANRRLLHRRQAA